MVNFLSPETSDRCKIDIHYFPVANTPYYHCISRCVRRGFLWGDDHLTGKNYSHRKSWVVDRLSYLSRVFSIDACSYAVMSNHYHLVLRVDKQQVLKWSEHKVVEQWQKIFKAPPIVLNYLSKANISDTGERYY